MRRIAARGALALFVLFVISTRAATQIAAPPPKDTVTLGIVPIVNRFDNTLESFNILRYYRNAGLYPSAHQIDLRLVESILETEFALSGTVAGAHNTLFDTKDASRWGLRTVDTITLALWRNGQRVSTMTASCDTTQWGPPKGKSHAADTRYGSLSPCLILLWPWLNGTLRSQLQSAAAAPAAPVQLATATARVDFDDPGYGGLRAGMSADSAVKVAWRGQNVFFDWSKALVAAEYKAAEVRYHWRPIRDMPWLPDADLFAPCNAGNSYVTLLFAGATNARLVRVALYLTEDCTARSDVIRALARRWGVELTETPTDDRFVIAGAESSIVGLLYSNLAVINFSAAGAPRYEGQRW